MNIKETIQLQIEAGKSVLVVDDSRSIRAIIKSILTKTGIGHLVEAENGLEGWDYLCAHPDEVEIVICDWDMPVLTGIELLERVRSDPRFANLPFLMVTTKSDDSSIKEAMNKGASQYVKKPFAPAAFVSEIAKVLGTKGDL